MECQGEDEEIVCLDESFFINDNYQLTRFTFGSHVLELYCLQSASMQFFIPTLLETYANADFDLTGQLVWPGAELLNDFLSKNADMLRGCSVIELGSGVGITGILCSRFCEKVVMTDHNEEILKRNIELHDTSQNLVCSAELKAEKLEWGNSEQLDYILQRHPKGFDLVLGADIYILILLFIMDNMVINEATRLGLRVSEVAGTRATVRNLEGCIYEITCG
ncbi:S-adenosylmethionine-dependent methyltransferase/methyltransferase [Striga asiatica]|uniref:S-adenosylmethionine-dependent methyltransferase/methyltransferase n=1 Tax=Striga asiatica TaxID=4170 RepID=A0A5A7Q3H8_STRAF|nr:S-adenosylmethionine-dependent methyltransferase/methyltransferase [Striga asiatica]